MKIEMRISRAEMEVPNFDLRARTDAAGFTKTLPITVTEDIETGDFIYEQDVCLRPEVQRFAELMESTLRKGDRAGKWHWSNTTLEFLQDKLVEEFVEVMVELKNIHRQRHTDYTLPPFAPEILQRAEAELVDLGNMCMMLADRVSLVRQGGRW